MPARARFGIRTQILAIAAAPTVIVAAILVFVIYRGTILEGDRALDRQGALLAAQLAVNLEYPLWAGALEQIPNTVAPLAAEQGLYVGQRWRQRSER